MSFIPENADETMTAAAAIVADVRETLSLIRQKDPALMPTELWLPLAEQLVSIVASQNASMRKLIEKVRQMETDAAQKDATAE